MIYLLDKFDPDLFEWDKEQYVILEFWETWEGKVKGWIVNERTRTIFGKQEIVNLFKIEEKVQMGKVDKIKIKKHDKIIIFTEKNKYYVLRVDGFYK